ncbi:MAG: cytochrome P450 [Deltaproteobacteria bacterium]|nr:cytochrome P450 [Deltaproteobacteria bacterium]MBW2447684.1 cytochrome P450 [Deltaproteobacteria bacterium]
MTEATTHASDAVFVPRSAETWIDPFTMYAALRDHDPVHEVKAEAGDYWVLSRFEDIMDAAVDFSTFSSAQGLTFTYGEMEELGVEAPIVMMDPPDHTALRKLATKRFTPKQVREVEPLIREFVVERVERLREMGEGDIIAELFKPLPSLVVAHALGVAQEERGQFDGWSDAIVSANATGDIMAASGAVAELFAYFGALIEKRRTDPGDDMISTLVHAELDGAPVSPAKLLGMAFTMVAGGNDTTTGLLGVAADLLTKNPDQRALILGDASHMKGTVEEFLRLASPVQGLARMTTRNVEVRGRTIPKDRKVMLLYASGNRDEREFGPTAAECDITRNIRRHLTFSYGAHHCIGAAIARLQATIALEELLARCPEFTVDADAARFAPGHFVRRYESMPFSAKGA